MAVNENGVFVVETPAELRAWMHEFHERCDDIWDTPSCAVYAMVQFVESWLDAEAEMVARRR